MEGDNGGGRRIRKGRREGGREGEREVDGIDGGRVWKGRHDSVHRPWYAVAGHHSAVCLCTDG